MAPMFKLADSSDQALVLQLMQEFYQVEQLDFQDDIIAAAVDQLLHNPHLGHIYLLQVAGESAGYLVVTHCFSLEFGGQFLLLDELYIRESYQGQGLGKASLEFLESVAHAEGINVIRMEVNQHNTRAKAVYCKSGYQDGDRTLFSKWLT